MKFARSSEHPNLAVMTLGVSIHVSQAEISRCRSTGDYFALANQKRDQAVASLMQQLLGLSIEIACVDALFEEPLAHREGATHR